MKLFLRVFSLLLALQAGEAAAADQFYLKIQCKASETADEIFSWKLNTYGNKNRTKSTTINDYIITADKTGIYQSQLETGLISDITLHTAHAGLAVRGRITCTNLKSLTSVKNGQYTTQKPEIDGFNDLPVDFIISEDNTHEIRQSGTLVSFSYRKF